MTMEKEKIFFKIADRELREKVAGALAARCDGKPIIFPKPTHGEGPGKKPYRSAAEISTLSVYF